MLDILWEEEQPNEKAKLFERSEKTSKSAGCDEPAVVLEMQSISPATNTPAPWLFFSDRLGKCFAEGKTVCIAHKNTAKDNKKSTLMRVL